MLERAVESMITAQSDRESQYEAERRTREGRLDALLEEMTRLRKGKWRSPQRVASNMRKFRKRSRKLSY